MLTITLQKSTRLPVLGVFLSPANRQVVIAPHVFFNTLRRQNSEGSADFHEVARLLDAGVISISDGVTTITSSVGLQAYLDAAGGGPIAVGPARSVLSGTGSVNAFTTQPTIEQLSIWDAAAAVARVVAISTAINSVDIRGSPLRAPDGLSFSTGVQTLDVSGSGVLALTAGQIEAETLVCTGALTGTRTLTIPAVAGGKKRIINATTGLQLFGATARRTAYSTSSSLVYVAPGQTKDFYAQGGVLYAIDPEVFVVDRDISLIFPNGTTTDTDICLTPPNSQLRIAHAYQLTATVGGTSTRRLGVTLGGNELLVDYTNPAPPLQGYAQGQLGTDMFTNFNAVYGASVPIRHRSVASVANVTAGLDRVHIEIVVFGN